VTTIVAALFLFSFGTGPVKGFAVTLTIGLLASLFTAVFVTGIVFDYFVWNRKVQKLSI
jgi:preprotein translocase subunit SecD